MQGSFFITVPNVFIELGLAPSHPIGSVSLGLSGFFAVDSKSFSLAERDKALSRITRFLEASESWRKLFPTDFAFFGHVIFLALSWTLFLLPLDHNYLKNVEHVDLLQCLQHILR
jgi:hypothetical protein